MLLAILGLSAVSFVVSWVVTCFIRPVAVRVGFVDKPGGRKIHANPKPLGGGVAIFLGIAAPMAAGLAYVHFCDPPTLRFISGNAAVPPWAAHWPGIRQQTPPALGILGAALLHAPAGADRRPQGDGALPEARRPTGRHVVPRRRPEPPGADVPGPGAGLGPVPSMVATILWIARDHQRVQLPGQHGRPVRRRSPPSARRRSSSPPSPSSHGSSPPALALLARRAAGVPLLQLPARHHLHGRQRQPAASASCWAC